MAMTGGNLEKNGSENSFKIEDLAKFAIEEHNKKEKATLEFWKVVNVKEQVDEGTIYLITVETIKGGNTKDFYYYEAKVLVKSWLNFKEVQAFKYLGSTTEDGTVL